MSDVTAGAVFVLRRHMKVHRHDDPTFCTILPVGMTVLVLSVPQRFEPLAARGQTVVLCGTTLWYARRAAVMSCLQAAQHAESCQL